jgi:hypothetical protein
VTFVADTATDVTEIADESVDHRAGAHPFRILIECPFERSDFASGLRSTSIKRATTASPRRTHRDIPSEIRDELDT